MLHFPSKTILKFPFPFANDIYIVQKLVQQVQPSILYLNNDATQTLVYSIVIGRLDYCDSLLYKVLAVHMSKLQRIQNSAARLVCSTPRFNHITPVLFSLHWLPVAYRIEFKILVLSFNSISTCAVLHLQASSIKGEM